MSPLLAAKCSDAKAIMRCLMVLAASQAAQPFKSEPVDAAVGEVLGTSAVEVALGRMRSMSTPKTSATTWATLTNSPCPISVPPWFSRIEPSV